MADCTTCRNSLGPDEIGVHRCTVYDVGPHNGYDPQRFNDNGDFANLPPHWRVLYGAHRDCPFHSAHGSGTIETGPPPLKE